MRHLSTDLLCQCALRVKGALAAGRGGSHASGGWGIATNGVGRWGFVNNDRGLEYLEGSEVLDGGDVTRGSSVEEAADGGVKGQGTQIS